MFNLCTWNFALWALLCLSVLPVCVNLMFRSVCCLKFAGIIAHVFPINTPSTPAKFSLLERGGGARKFVYCEHGQLSTSINLPFCFPPYFDSSSLSIPHFFFVFIFFSIISLAVFFFLFHCFFPLFVFSFVRFLLCSFALSFSLSFFSIYFFLTAWFSLSFFLIFSFFLTTRLKYKIKL